MGATIRIGLVFSYSLAYCRGILRGVKRYAQLRPDWVLTPIDPDPAGVSLLRRLRPTGIIAHIFSDRLADTLQSLRRPLVNVSGVLDRPRIARVGLDDEAIGEMAAHHLLNCGLRHFAFVGHRDHAYSIHRENGFNRVIRRAGRSIFTYFEANPAFNPRGRLWSIDRRLLNWVESLPRPVGVFACNDLWGMQLSEACRQRGLHVPDDVAIIGVDNDDLLCEIARPSLSSVAVPAEQVGYKAAALLDRLMGDRPCQRDPLLVQPLYVLARQSSNTLAVQDQDVAAAMRLIRNQSLQRLSVQDIATAVAVSRRSLERRFRRAFGRTIGNEIRRRRVEKAKALLATTQLPASAVAVASGFSSSKHLAVVFRQETGITPTQHRQLCMPLA